MSLKTQAQQAVLGGLKITGIAAALSPLTAGQGAIFTLHRVRPAVPRPFAPNAHLEVTPEFLAVAVERLRHAGADIVTLDEALRRLRDGDQRRFAVLTFDDGYRDNLVHALPVLRAAEAPFTVFVATGMIDRAMVPWWMVIEEIAAAQDEIRIRGPQEIHLETRSISKKYETFGRLVAWLTAIDEDRQRREVTELAARYGVDPRAILDREMMTWDEVRRLAAEPLVTIGAHTVGHYALAKLSLPRAREEVVESADRLEAELGRRPRHFAYPYGYPEAADEREFHLIADLGFASAVRTVPGTLGPEEGRRPTALPRISLNGHFQAARYVDVLASGAPFALQALRKRFGPRPSDGRIRAAASSE